MEENMNMSAEHSLKIITEQIERNRKAVSKDVGESLYMAGICTMTMAIVVAIVNGTAMKYGFSGVGHLLWFLLPLIIWGVEKYRHKDRPATPPNIISTLVAKTWVTFGIFTLAFFFFATLFNNIVVRTETIDGYGYNDYWLHPEAALAGMVWNHRWCRRFFLGNCRCIFFLH